MRDFHTLRVQETRIEIGGNAKTVCFEIPDNLRDMFMWRPGQHLSFRFEIDGQEYRRSYSISSSPFDGAPLRVTVKRVKGGVVSNHINDRIETGDMVDVMPPFGGFCLDPEETNRRTHYFFGAGSGITPLYAMASGVMAGEPNSVAHLVYGNANEKSILLEDDLNTLAAAHPDRFSIHHVFSNPGWWSSAQYWRRGKVDKQAVQDVIDEHPPYAQDVQYYICGPGGMNGSIRAALMSLDVPPSRIHMETYGANAPADTSVQGLASKARVTLGGQTHEVALGENQTILDAVKLAGLKPPFSCQSGVCGACRATLTKGDIHMRARMALEDHDINQGAILTCQSVATSTTLDLSYD